MIPAVIAYLGLLLFMIGEKQLRVGEGAKELRFAADPSTLILGLSYGANFMLLLVGTMLGFKYDPAIPSGLGWVGDLVMFGGLCLRVIANRQLGKYYTRSLMTYENQKIVSTGLYRYIRHPGYLGLILMWFGAAITTRSAWFLLPMLLITAVAYGYRIVQEEKKLGNELGDDYRRYMERTKRLVPFVF